MLRFAIAMSISLLIAGCQSGRDFQRPTGADLTLGTATEADVRARFGEPERIERHFFPIPTTEQIEALRSPFDSFPAEGLCLRLHYDFREQGLGANHFKRANFTFLNGTLIGYDFLSNDGEESTKFDEMKISRIQKGISSEGDVKRIMGKPSGYSLYPGVRDKENRVLYYSFVDFDTTSSSRSRGVMELSFLQVLIGPDNIVIDYRYRSGTQPRPK